MDEEEQPNSFNNKLKPVSIDENGEPVYLLGDYIQHQIDEVDAEIDEVCAVFGECNDVECSYNKGYLKRQALYACLTCIPESKLDVSKAAGVCLACSLHCHNGHDQVELYTKRNFRCDCGNSKFESSCTLIPEKVPFNTANSYNQNFTGLYCTCARPYPDPDDDIEDDMISCALCEDWFHTRHLGIACPPSNSYEEMICEACIRKHDFLLHYDGLSMTKIDNTEAATGDVNVVDVNNDTYNTDFNLEDVGAVTNPEEERSEQKAGNNKSKAGPKEAKGPEEEDDVQEITRDDEGKMDMQESISVPQQERNDICDNLDDITRQCEEIDKAFDDSTKLEALAVVSADLDEETKTTESANTDAISNEQKDGSNAAAQTVEQEESSAVLQVTTDQGQYGNDLKEADEKLEEDIITGLDGEASSTAQWLASKDSKNAENTIKDGETKRYCKKPKIKSTHISTKFFESSRWRENLCTCTDCTKLYADNNVTYLLDPQDTLQFYKEFGREVYVEGAYGAFKRKLDSLPQTDKIFLVEQMADFKDKFGEFLKQCGDEQRVITSEDVRTFFQNLDQSRKRRKVQMESNYYCR